MAAKVSFAVTLYNESKWIERAARHLFEQTMDDLEYVFINDGSTDDSVDIILHVLEDYPRRKNQVRIINHEHNMGCAAAKRDSFLYATGDYVLSSDADDYVDIHIAEKLYNKAVETDADMVVCNAWFENAKRPGEFFIHDFLPEGVVGDGENVRFGIITRQTFGSLWTRLVKREIYTKNEIMWPVSNKICDQPITVQLAYYSKKIAGVPEPLYYYFYHESSVSRDVTKEARTKIFESFKTNFQLIVDFLKSKGAYEEYEPYLILNYKARIRNLLIKYIDDRQVHKLWKKTFPEVNRVYLLGSELYKPSYRERIWFICVWLGLYPYLKRILFCKYLRPRSNWMIPYYKYSN